MAFVNGLYVFIEDGGESITRGVEVTQHAVEEGLPITDNVKRSPVSLSLSGKIVGEDAETIKNSLEAMHQKGMLVKYQGIHMLKNAIITAFETSVSNAVYGGYVFSMTIDEVRIANSAYAAPNTKSKSKSTGKKVTKGGTQQVQDNGNKKYHTVKKGDTLWSIAKKYYGDGRMYTKIYQANKDKIKDAHWIYPNQVFLIP